MDPNASLAKPKRRNVGYHAHEAEQLHQAELRAFVAYYRKKGLAPAKIAAILQVTPRAVKRCMDRSLQRIQEIEAAGVNIHQATRRPRDPGDTQIGQRPRKGPGAGTHRRTSTKLVTAPANIARVRELHKMAWDLRKKQIPFDEIAEMLSITEQEARNLVKRRLEELDRMELESTDEARTLMVSQIESMMRALIPSSTGEQTDGAPVVVNLDSIDRMVKLMKAKADLLGLNAATKVDMTVTLKEFAETEGYDYNEVEEVAAEVIASMSRRRGP